jgi:PKD repeat protein
MAYIYFDWNPYVETNTVTSHLIYFLPPLASFTTGNTTICNLNCIDFSNTSANATSWQWLFPGAVPSSSADENPQGICFVADGLYDVTLIASNAFSSDTNTILNYLTVNPLPPPPTIYEVNDTLYCNFDPLYTAYQWYDTTGLIVGATDSFYVPPFSGLYGISVYNQYGCEAATTLPIILDVPENDDYGFSVFPNPANEMLYIKSKLFTDDAMVEITNVLGEKMMVRHLQKSVSKSEIEMDVRNFSPGIYFVKFQNQDRTVEKRFVKN